jgi:GGDEF domain-containing protein
MKGAITMALSEIDFNSESKSYLGKVASLLDTSTGWYRQWYMSLRLEEESLRARRYGRKLSLIAIRLSRESSHGSFPRQHLLETLSSIASQNLRASDLPGLGESNEYLVLLPETDRAGAEIVAERLSERLGDFNPIIGIGVQPDDGTTLAEILSTARRVAGSDGSDLRAAS